jgi:hypothetical protein
MSNLPTNRTSPRRRPGAQELFTLLGGDPKSDTTITRVIEALDLDDLASLAGLVKKAHFKAKADAWVHAYQDVQTMAAQRVDAIREGERIIGGGQ